MDTLYSRNNVTKYRYFLVRNDSEKIQSLLPLQVFTMYVFQNPVTKERGVSVLSGNGVNEITPVLDEDFQLGSFSHPVYTNQNKEPLKMFYTQVPQKYIPVSSSRNEKIS